MKSADAVEIVSFELKKVSPATRLEKLQWEKEFLGLFVSGHPLQGLKNIWQKSAFHRQNRQTAYR